MSHEQFWSWLYVIGTAGLGWTPGVVMHCDMSDILLAWEGKRMIADRQAEPDDVPGLTADTFRSMVKGKS